MRGRDPDNFGNENHPPAATLSFKELLMEYVNSYTFYYQAVLALISLIAIICFAASSFTEGLLSFSKFFITMVLLSVIIDFILRSLNFHRLIPDILKSSFLLTGIHAVGVILAFILGPLLISKTEHTSLMIGGISTVLVGILLAVPAYLFAKTCRSNGYCIISDFPI
ncbi:hypothetical protein HZS_432 [Henneguya salminicola]|nr:hypothetical protein HZS_432 [Henneguya salminicola]